MEVVTKDIKMDISIYKLDNIVHPSSNVYLFSISYCTADPTFDHVFAFICHSPSGEGLACHTFLCPKRKMVGETPHAETASALYVSG